MLWLATLALSVCQEVGQPFPMLEFPLLGEAGVIATLEDFRGDKVPESAEDPSPVTVVRGGG